MVTPQNLFGQKWVDSVVTYLPNRHRDYFVDNHKAALKRCLPKFNDLPGLGTERSTPLAVIGGGPSLKLAEIEQFNGERMVCGTAHGHLRRNNVRFDYAVAYEPDPVETLFFMNPLKTAHYLVATHCHISLFDVLQACRVSVWCSAGDMPRWHLPWPPVGGGCMVALRAIPLAVIMGYKDLHLFGIDSSFSDDGEYAYDQREFGAAYRTPTLIHRKVGDRSFMTSRAFDLQARQLMSMLDKWGHLFKVTVHGDSMIAAMVKEREDANGADRV